MSFPASVRFALLLTHEHRLSLSNTIHDRFGFGYEASSPPFLQPPPQFDEDLVGGFLKKIKTLVGHHLYSKLSWPKFLSVEVVPSSGHKRTS